MSDLLALILTVSLTLLVAVLVHRVFTKRTAALPGALVMAGAVSIVYAIAPSAVQTRASSDEMASIGFCYAAMMLGMIAEYGFAQAERRNRKLELDWMSFVMPVLASPIVFIPVLTLMTEATMGGAFTRGKLMVYLVAFQNGFFWKSFFEQRRAEARIEIHTEPAALAREPHAA
jgi:hypothetical protein